MILRKTNIYILLLLLFSAISCIFYVYLLDIETSFILKSIYILVNLIIIYIIRYKYGSYINVLTLFLLFVLFFNGSRIILDLFGYDDMRELYVITQATIKEDVNNRAILNVILAITSVSLGYFFYKESTYARNKFSFFIPNSFLIVLFIIGFTAKIYIAYLSFSFLSLFSYGEVFTDGIPIPSYIQVLSFLPVFVSLYKFKSGKGGFWILSLFAYSILSMATGQRGPGMILIIVTLYLCTKLKLIKINLIYLIFLIPIVVILLLTIGYLRRDKDVEFESDFLIAFFWGQSVSIDVLQLAIQDYHKLDYGFWDLFGNIRYTIERMTIYRGMPQDQLAEMAKYKMWSSYITYMVSPKFYFEGMGLGGNYIGQSYAVGKEFFVVAVSFFVGKFLHFVEDKIFSNNIYVSFISFIVLQSLLYIPRDNLFDFITDIRMPLFMLLLVYVIRCVIKLTFPTSLKN